MYSRAKPTDHKIFSVLWRYSLAAGTPHAPGGTVRALAMGVDRYPNLDQKAQRAGAVANTRDISRVLAAAGVKVQTLTNGDVVRSRATAEMNRLVDESKSGGLAIISYCGHGMLPVRPRPSTQQKPTGFGRNAAAAHRTDPRPSPCYR
jgi:hypothetical protein